MTWKALLRVGLVVLVLLSGFGCVKKFPMPEHTNLEPIEVGLDEALDSVRFEGLFDGIKTGQMVFSGYTETADLVKRGYGCYLRHVGQRYWDGKPGWNKNFADRIDDYYSAFYETMKSLGYNVVGDPSVLFDRGKELQKAKYSVAGRVLDVRGNHCMLAEIWSNQVTSRVVAEMYIKMEWSVYSNVEKRVVSKFITTGYYNEPTGVLDGKIQTLVGAFSNAIENMAANKDIYNILARKADDVKVGRAGPVGEKIVIPKLELSRDEFSMHADNVVDAVVTFPHGQGHGSGFLISKNGYILTNAHVVGDLEDISVNFGNGLELVGEVVKKDVIHDVALVKVGLSRAKVIPIMLEYPKPGKTVYAIGAPLDTAFEKTITKGIVSKVVYAKHVQMNAIQSDASIHGGNSGGPLVDENGNVVGICAYHYTPSIEKLSIGLNYFLTIADSLKALNIEIGEKP